MSFNGIMPTPIFVKIRSVVPDFKWWDLQKKNDDITCTYRFLINGMINIAK
jgi:hypothetical protein